MIMMMLRVFFSEHPGGMARLQFGELPQPKVDLNDSHYDLTGVVDLIHPAVNQVPVINVSGQDIYEMLRNQTH